jgi:hypothetical protein
VQHELTVDRVEYDEFPRLQGVAGEALPRVEIRERDEAEAHAACDALANLLVPVPEVFEAARAARHGGKLRTRASTLSRNGFK